MNDALTVATQHVVVDGSNIATEARPMPSLAQLESALVELRKDFPDSEITVVVDATFAHRIDLSELERYEELHLSGGLVSPPAGAIGRGDAFLLRIAEKVDGTVLSNDSFQEFHGEHPWLFERGRLLGATPVPGVGWIFVPRTPVRGPKSRVAVRDAAREHAKVNEAIAEATREVEDPGERVERESSGEARGRRARSRRAVGTPQAINDPMSFITFIAAHRLGDEVEAEVEGFTSHGAVLLVGEVRCYAPLVNLGEPPPRSARAVLGRGATERFVVTALDPYRRGIELALPGFARVSGHPTEETVEAEVRLARRPRRGRGGSAEVPTAARAAMEADGADAGATAPLVPQHLDAPAPSPAPEPESGQSSVASPEEMTPPVPTGSRRGRGRGRSPKPETESTAPGVAEGSEVRRRVGANQAGATEGAPEHVAPRRRAVPRKKVSAGDAAAPAPAKKAPAQVRASKAAEQSPADKAPAQVRARKNAATAAKLAAAQAPAKKAPAQVRAKKAPAQVRAKKAPAQVRGAKKVPAQVPANKAVAAAAKKPAASPKAASAAPVPREPAPEAPAASRQPRTRRPVAGA